MKNDTTTDAAEARARREALALIAELIAKESSRKIYGINGVLTNKLATISLTLERPLATAEAASGAGEREVFGYWVEQKHADPVLLRKPAYIPEPSDLRPVTPLYASLPPATDPAMVRKPTSAMIDAARKAITDRYYRGGNVVQMTAIQPREMAELVLTAALAAAPTIPATGEDGWTDAGRAWLAAGAPTIPATGHAATVAPDDLRPWGYAPGEYVFRCRDCPADLPFEQRPLGDKRSWRCKPHAETARAVSGHAATEGEGA